MSQSMKALNALLNEGISLTEAADRFGISKAAVSKAKLNPSKKQVMTQTIEQLKARVRELEAEVERLSVAHVKACQANADSQAELAKAEQRVAEACALQVATETKLHWLDAARVAKEIRSGEWRKFVKEV